MLRSESAGGYPEGTTPTSWGEHVTDHGRDAGGRRMLGDLIAAGHLMSMEELPGAVAERAADAGFPEVLIYLGDLRGQVLRLVTGEGLSGACHERELRVEGTVPGRSYQYGQVIAAAPDGSQWWLPLMDGTERLGVLRVASAHTDDRAGEDAASLSGLVALMIVTKRNGAPADQKGRQPAGASASSTQEAADP
ncbi:hypothetical protein [Streptomyces rishiriensis]|uniref:hypothetical protein n=1 Tax=Streptomyces rishiriensis TaxID=68264 RepID=UPI000D59F56C|nr:hypothetical protein [Streptomyces rishiriensis]